MKKLLASVSLALVCLFSQSQTAPQNGTDLLILPSTSSQWIQPDVEIPYRIVSLDATTISTENPQNASDVLESSGEVFLQKNSPGGGIPLMRGFASNRQLFLIDGIRLTTAVSLSGNLQNVMAIDPFYLEKAEIRFGPGAANVASDAIGGILSFETLEPKLSNSSETSISGNAVTLFSSANREYTGHVDINVGRKKWASTTSISFSDFGDIRMGSHGPREYLNDFYVENQGSSDVEVINANPIVQHPTAFSRANLMEKILYTPNTNWDVSYGFYFSRTSETPHYDKLLMTRDGYPLMAESYYGPQIWMMNHIAASYKWPSSICDRLDISVAQQYFKDSRTDRYFNDPIRYRRQEIINSYTINIDMTKCTRQGHELTYGLEIIYDNISAEGTDEDIYTGEMLPGPGSYAQTGWGSYGMYVSYKFWINSKMNFTAGARYNLYLLNAKFDSNFYNLPYKDIYVNNDGITGNAGFVFKPSQKWLLNANFSTGLRSPNADDISRMLDAQPGSVVVPNPYLKSEYALNLEIGASKIFGDYFNAYFTVYSTYVDRALVCRSYTLNNRDSILFEGEMTRVMAIQNASHAIISGFQAGFDAFLPMGFGMTTRFNFQKGVEKLFDGTSSPLDHAAPFFGKVALTYTTSRLNTEIYADFNGRISYENLPPEEKDRAYLYAADENGNPYAPAWCTLNLKAMYHFNRVFAVSGGIENLTNVRYRPYSSGITAAGINFTISVKASF